MKRLVILTCFLALAGASAVGDTVLYDNTTAASFTNGNSASPTYQISGSYSGGGNNWVADSFTISANDIVDSISFGTWIQDYYETPALAGVNWTISTSKYVNNGVLSSGVGTSFTKAVEPESGSNGYYINTWLFNLSNPVSLAPGTYYLYLSNVSLAASDNPSPVYWDISNNPSSKAYSINKGYGGFSTSSNTFTLIGVDPPPSVPESSGPFDLCLAALAIAAAAFYRRRVSLRDV